MGAGKKNALNAATGQGQQSQGIEDQRAQEMQNNANDTRNAAVNTSLGLKPQIEGALTNQLNGTGGIPNVSGINAQFQKSADTANSLSGMGRLSPQIGQNLATNPEDIKNAGSQVMGAGSSLANTKPLVANATDASYGRGREGYQAMADNGGYNQNQRDAFIRSGTRAATAGYSANQDQLNRRLSVQGGYMPGYTAGADRLSRSSADAAAEANTNANIALGREVNSNKLSGLGGLASTREAAGQEAQAAQNASIGAQSAGGNLMGTGANILQGGQTSQINQQKSQADAEQAAQNAEIQAKTAGASASTASALGQSELAQAQGKGTQGAIDSLIKYYQSNVDQVNDSDKIAISNRLAQLGMTQARINELLGSASQQASGLQTAGSIIGDASSILGGVGGLATGINSGGSK